MTDRIEADAFARELVTLGAFRWFPGMLARDDYGPFRISVGYQAVPMSRIEPPWPDLLDPTTAALLAVQAMEAGIELAAIAPGTWWARMPGQPHGVEGPLGIVAARALIALGGGHQCRSGWKSWPQVACSNCRPSDARVR